MTISSSLSDNTFMETCVSAGIVIRHIKRYDEEITTIPPVPALMARPMNLASLSSESTFGCNNTLQTGREWNATNFHSPVKISLMLQSIRGIHNRRSIARISTTL